MNSEHVSWHNIYGVRSNFEEKKVRWLLTVNLEPRAKRQGVKFMLFNKDESSYKQRGFTLIEVLVAMAIFSIGILGVGSMQLKSTGGNTSARIRTEASIWGQDRVETLMLEKYDTDPLLNSPLLTVGNHTAPPNTADLANYQMQWKVWDDSGAVAGAVTQSINGTTPSPNTIIVEVTITGRGNKSSTVVFVKAQDV